MSVLVVRSGALDAAATECRRARDSDGLDALTRASVLSGPDCGDDGCAAALSELLGVFRSAASAAAEGSRGAVSSLATIAAEFERVDGQAATAAATATVTTVGRGVGCVGF